MRSNNSLLIWAPTGLWAERPKQIARGSRVHADATTIVASYEQLREWLFGCGRRDPLR
jgi:hypothetical protein